VFAVRTLTPTLLRGPEDLAITEDEDAQFSAILEGKPEPAIQWYAAVDSMLVETSVQYGDRQFFKRERETDRQTDRQKQRKIVKEADR